MAPSKKFTAEQIKERRRLREKERREKRRSDPNLCEEDRQKEKLHHLKKKLKGQVKPIADLSARDQRAQREKWRERSEKHYRNMKSPNGQASTLTVPDNQNSSPTSEPSSSHSRIKWHLTFGQWSCLVNSRSTMDGAIPVSFKKEITSELDDHHADELIIPDFVSAEDLTSPDEDSAMERAIKVEPSETPNFVGEDQDLDNPYQCFECGLDCKSQGELIDHYESTHNDEKTDYNGHTFSEADDTAHDPLAGDIAPDSPEKTANVEGAQNDATPLKVLLLYSCPCCGHTSNDWNRLFKHMEKHVQVTSSSCSNCIYIFSNSYHLKDYTGRDSLDEPHVCCHCPFKTQRYQALKDHCVTHHKNIAAIGSSNNHDQNHIPSDDSNCIKNCVSQTTSVQATLETINSQPHNSIPPVEIPYSGGQPGYVVFRSSIPGVQNLGNIAVPANNFIPGVQGTKIGPYCVNVIPQVMNLNPMPLLQQELAVNTTSNLPNKEIIPSLIPKLENPTESNLEVLPGLPLSIPKLPNRILPPKVPVNELLKKWSFPNVPKPTQLSPKVAKVPPQPTLPIHLTGMPTSRAPKGSSVNSRRGIKNKPCPYCSHVARDSHSLKTHIFIHTKEKPFACEFCEYRATQRAHIKKHMATHENGNRRKKTFCPQ